MATEIDGSISIRLALKPMMIDEMAMDNYVWIYDKSIIIHTESERKRRARNLPEKNAIECFKQTEYSYDNKIASMMMSRFGLIIVQKDYLVFIDF